MKTIIDSFIEKDVLNLSVDAPWGQRVYNITGLLVDDKVLKNDLAKKIKSKTITSISELDLYIEEQYLYRSPKEIQ